MPFSDTEFRQWNQVGTEAIAVQLPLLVPSLSSPSREIPSSSCSWNRTQQQISGQPQCHENLSGLHGWFIIQTHIPFLNFKVMKTMSIIYYFTMSMSHIASSIKWHCKDSGESESECKCHSLFESKILTFSWNNSGNIRTKIKTQFCIRDFVLIFVTWHLGRILIILHMHRHDFLSFPFIFNSAC
jgi:hypothetical protein